jgi:hypothetical protein
MNDNRGSITPPRSPARNSDYVSPSLSLATSSGSLSARSTPAAATAIPAINISPYENIASAHTTTPTATAVAVNSVPPRGTASYSAVGVAAAGGNYDNTTITVSAVRVTANSAPGSSVSASRVTGVALFGDNEVLQALGKC